MVLANDKAIDFTLLDDNGNEFMLSNIKDKTIILYFYSKDNTIACTAQALLYKELYDEFNKLNTIIVGISKDSIDSHKKFKLKYELPFTLLSDKDKEVVSLYDCLKKKDDVW